MKTDVRFALIEDHFHGNPKKRIQGSCAQLIEGVGAFLLLYNCMEGKKNCELILKPLCCGKNDSSIYVAGVHFTAEDINTFGINKKMKGHALWTMGLTVLCSIKKALSIVPKFLPGRALLLLTKIVRQLAMHWKRARVCSCNISTMVCLY
jgi:hypothetical protein